MAGVQAAAAAVLGGGGGGVLSGTSGSGSSRRNGAIAAAGVEKTVCSAKLGSGSVQQGPIAVSSRRSGPSLERPASRASNARVGAQPVACATSANEVAVGSAHVGSATKLEAAPTVEEKGTENAKDPPPVPSPETSISGFMADVANLIKLVDSRDIVELELKHKEYEIIIRKEAQQPPPPMAFPGPHVMAHTTVPGYASPPPPPTLVPAPAPAVAEPAPLAAAAAAAAPVPSPAKPSHPPMLSPMAGTFYRNPAPGESAFVQVGDKVTKGQVVCIVEAMKLMNEIEADQSGTLVEILAEDGKPVSMETPIFLIKP